MAKWTARRAGFSGSNISRSVSFMGPGDAEGMDGKGGAGRGVGS